MKRAISPKNELVANSHFGRRLLWYSRQNDTRLRNMTMESRHERVIDVRLNWFRTKIALLHTSPIGKVHVQDSNEGLSPIDCEGFAVRIVESQFYGGRVDFNAELHQDVLDETSHQHRYGVGVNITSEDKLDMGVEGLGLKRVAGFIISWV